MKITRALQEYLLEIEIRKYTQKTFRSCRNNRNLFARYLNEEAKIDCGFNLHKYHLSRVAKAKPVKAAG